MCSRCNVVNHGSHDPRSHFARGRRDRVAPHALLVVDRALLTVLTASAADCRDSGIDEDRDGVGGVLAVCTETTDRVMYARCVGVLRELDGRLSTARTAADACQIAGQTLDAAAAHSVAFSLIYLIEQKRARLVAASPYLAPHAAP